MGTMIESVLVGLAPGRSPCSVSGRPSLVAHTVEGSTVPGLLSEWSLHYRGPVLLTRHQEAEVQLTWPSACFSQRSGASWFTLGYAGRTWTGPVRMLSDRCHLEPTRPLGAIGVSRFFPPNFRAAHRVSAYTGVRARAPRRVSVPDGQPLDLVITLVARHDVVLDPCPDYVMGANSGHGRRYALNCAAVPWRDSTGRPYLPAGRRVSFAMHLGGTLPRIAKVWWRIVAPGSRAQWLGIARR